MKNNEGGNMKRNGKNLKPGVLALAGMLLVAMMFTLQSQSLAAEKDWVVPASRIIDQDVYDQSKEIIGEVEDIVIRRSGRTKKLVIEYGGFYDIADRLVGLPFKRSQLLDDRIVIETTKAQLDKKPAFNYARDGLLTQYFYYSRPPHPYPSTSYYYDPTLRRERQLDMEELALSPSHFLASVIMNRRMINNQGQDIGWVEDLLINTEQNKVEKIIISTEHLLIKGPMLALPYRPVGFSGYGLVYDISLSDLQNMPQYSVKGDN
jgi:sporulation protein YlmC with PRC-barrel domain